VLLGGVPGTVRLPDRAGVDGGGKVLSQPGQRRQGGHVHGHGAEPDPRTYADRAFPERNYYFKFPGRAYNVSVRFADQADAPADYNPFPAPAACNPNAPRPFKPIDYKRDCMQLVAALKSCKFPF
jgi:hypothetical protein